MVLSWYGIVTTDHFDKSNDICFFSTSQGYYELSDRSISSDYRINGRRPQISIPIKKPKRRKSPKCPNCTNGKCKAIETFYFYFFGFRVSVFFLNTLDDDEFLVCGGAMLNWRPLNIHIMHTNPSYSSIHYYSI